MSKHTYNRQGWKNTPKRKRRTQRSGKKPSFKPQGPILKNIILALIAIGIAGSLVGLGIIAFIARDLPNPNTLTERTISQTTKIYDSTGEHLLYEIFGDENRTLKQIQEGFCNPNTDMELDPEGIPLYALQATVAAEDRNFCNHSGFDFRGFARAVFQNLLGNRQGGSTLTQQLVKNAILSNEQTITRKIKELILSLELERRYSKDEILQIYFNEIPYGSTYYGIEAAAQNYFDKSAHELTIAEAATLASLPKAPTTYINNPDRLKARRDYILGGMLELGFIDQMEHDLAVASETPVEISYTNIDAPHFVFYVTEQLEETYGRRAVEEGGMRVITSLDYDMQMIAEEEVANGIEEVGELYNVSNAALVATDPDNGHILAMVGSRNYFDDEIDGQVNVATRLRQPGSSFKPIVYTKAFEMGYTPNTILWDVKTTFPTVTGNYTPLNYDLQEHGPVRMRDSLQWSLNITAVKALYLVGVENALDFATQLGYTSFEDHSAFGLSLVLGGGEVQLVEHVNTYATFANEGVRQDLVSILKVEDSTGEVLEEWKEEEGERVLDENIARMITHVLKDNESRSSVFGGTSNLQLGDRPVAAKTGTTNDYRDAWLMGYTPSLAAGVWAGNNDNTAMNRGAGGSSVAGPIWNGFMRRALEEEPIEYFTNPVIDQTGVAALDGSITSTTLIVDKASGKIATEYTPESYREERTYAEYHSILHYVTKESPRDGIPEDPTNDPYYEPWEAAIQEWITAKEEEEGVEIVNEAPPTEEDDVHVPSNFPSVEITSPDKNDDVDRTITISVDADAPRGVSRVEFYIDGQYLGSDTRSPYKLVTDIPSSIGRGVHSIKAIAYDDVDNAGSDTVSINIEEDAGAALLELIDPNNGQTIERTDETYTIVLSLEDPEKYQSVTVYAEELSTGSRSTVGEVVNPDSPFLTLEWNLPTTGTWALSATATDGDLQLSTAGSLVTITDPNETTEETSEETEEAPEEGADTEEETTEEVFVADEELNLF
jgi:membrane peptidoglycan carboxypeptidase